MRRLYEEISPVMNRATRQLGEWFRFGLIGILATLTYLIVSSLALLSGAFAYQANLLGYLFSVAISYFGHARYTFRSHRPHRVQGPKFLAVSLATFALTNLIIYIVVDALDHDPYVATVVVALTIPGITWALSRFWIFHNS